MKTYFTKDKLLTWRALIYLFAGAAICVLVTYIVSLVAQNIRFDEYITTAIVFPIIVVLFEVPGIAGFLATLLIEFFITNSSALHTTCYMVGFIGIAFFFLLFKNRFQDLTTVTKYFFFWLASAIGSLFYGSMITILDFSFPEIAEEGFLSIFVDNFSHVFALTVCVSSAILALIELIKRKIHKTSLTTSIKEKRSLTALFLMQSGCAVIGFLFSIIVSKYDNDYFMWANICELLSLISVLCLCFLRLLVSKKRLTLFIFSALFLIIFVFNLIMYDTGWGIYIVLVSFIMFALHAIFYNKFEALLEKKNFVSIFFRVMRGLLLAVYVLVLSLEIATFSMPTAINEKYAILLGAPVYNNKATVLLEDRIEIAELFLKVNPDAIIVLSGGAKDNGLTESDIMYEKLTSAGIDPKRLIIENNSKTTLDNFKNSSKMLESYGFDIENDTLAIITNDFHSIRAKLYSARAGIKNVVFAETLSNFFSTMSWYPREVVALVAMLLFH